MKSLITKLIILTALAVTALVPVLTPQVLAQSKKDACEGVALTGQGCDSKGGPSVDSTIKLAINLLSILVGIAAVIMIIIGGFKYVISSGDSNNINSAKNTILYALVGLVIVALAQIIVVFVLNKAAPTCSPTVTVNCTPAP